MGGGVKKESLNSVNVDIPLNPCLQVSFEYGKVLDIPDTRWDLVPSTC